MDKDLFLQIRETIEEVIKMEFGLSPTDNRLEQAVEGIAAWGLIKGSANIYIVLSDAEKYCYFQVFSPILTYEDNVSKEFFIKLLSLNATTEMLDAAFAIKDNRIILKTDMILKSPEKELIVNSILHLGEIADKYDDILKQEFSGVNLI